MHRTKDLVDSGHDTHGAGAAVGIRHAVAEPLSVSFRRQMRNGKEGKWVQHTRSYRQLT